MTANTGGGQFRAGVVAAYDIGEARLRNPSEYVELSPTITARCGTGGNNVPATVYALQANGIDRADTVGCNGAGWREDQCYTLNTIDRHAVCYDARGNGDGRVAPTITGDHNNRTTDYTALTVYPKVTGPLMANSHPGSYTGQDAFSDMLPVVPSDKPPRKYIVRRLTPVECARLQGFPDWWCMGLETPEPTEEDIAWAAEVWERWRLITSPNTKPKSRNQLIKWLKNPHSDAAEYKLWGNGIALPCAVRVMEGIAKEEHHEPED